MIFKNRRWRTGPQTALPHLAVGWLQRRWGALLRTGTLRLNTIYGVAGLIAITAWLFLMPFLAHAGEDRYALRIDGLACPFCAYGVEKKLNEIPGVERIDVDIKKGEVVLTLSKGATLAEPIAREKVKRAGFTLRSMQRLGGGE